MEECCLLAYFHGSKNKGSFFVIWRRVTLVRTDVAEEHISSILMVTRLGDFLAVSEDVPHDIRGRETPS
jgi:hypothetical protein